MFRILVVGSICYSIMLQRYVQKLINEFRCLEKKKKKKKKKKKDEINVVFFGTNVQLPDDYSLIDRCSNMSVSICTKDFDPSLYKRYNVILDTGITAGYAQNVLRINVDEKNQSLNELLLQSMVNLLVEYNPCDGTIVTLYDQLMSRGFNGCSLSTCFSRQCDAFFATLQQMILNDERMPEVSANNDDIECRRAVFKQFDDNYLHSSFFVNKLYGMMMDKIVVKGVSNIDDENNMVNMLLDEFKSHDNTNVIVEDCFNN